jgi:16S rRNA processing protein RimM
MHHAENLKLLGVILKSYGVEGKLVLKLAFFSEEELVEGEPVFVEIDGIPVPFFISDFQYSSDNSAILALDEINTSPQASSFINCRVFIGKQKPGEILEDNNERSDQLKGFRVIDKRTGNTGILKQIIEFPDNPVMALDHEGTEVLIPFHKDIIRKIDHQTGVIEIIAPDGLFDLYL